MLLKGLSFKKAACQCMRKVVLFIMFTGMFVLSSYQSQLSKEEYTDIFLPESQHNLYLQFNEQVNNVNDSLLNIKALMALLYYENNYKPIWTFETQLNEEGKTLIDLLAHAEYFGFRASSYGVPLIQKQIKQLSEAAGTAQILTRRLVLENLLSVAALKFMMNLKSGDINFNTYQFTTGYAQYFIETLHQALHKPFRETILSVQPEFTEYQRLQKANEKFVRQVNLNNHAGNLVYPVVKNKYTKHLVTTILYHYGFVTSPDAMDEGSIKQGLKNFQKFHALEPNGVYTKETVKRLTKSTNDIFNLVAESLNYYRSKDIHADRCVWVNIPSFELKIIGKNQVLNKYNVVVGRKTSPTPEIESDIFRIVKNPYWTVPRKIAVNEIIPKIKNDPDYLSRNSFKIIDHEFNEIHSDSIDFNELNPANFKYKLRQESFGGNALGKVKFLFENPYSVYLHDTPSKSQFGLAYRAYSHGCIRVDKPLELAGDLLELSEQLNYREKSQLKSTQREKISLQKPLKIYITYQLCGADDNGNLVVYNDVYNKKNLN